jgi:hypothetical protein
MEANMVCSKQATRYAKKYFVLLNCHAAQHSARDATLLQSALGFDADTKTTAHESTNSFAKGYGGKYGVQQTGDKVSYLTLGLVSQRMMYRDWSIDCLTYLCCWVQSALGFDADTKTTAHESTNSFAKGYGGKYGVQQTGDKVCPARSNGTLALQV